MICKTCEKLAMYPDTHRCVNCPRFCNYKEHKWCDYCSSVKQICAVCGRQLPIKASTINDLSGQVELTHPFFPSNGGCKSCGGR